MRLFLILVFCLFVSRYQFQKFSYDTNNLFLERISFSYFSKDQLSIQFLEKGQCFKIFRKNKLVQSGQISFIYTSSKAVYQFGDQSYIGVVLLDSSLYITKIEKSLSKIDFNTLTFFGTKKLLIYQ